MIQSQLTTLAFTQLQDVADLIGNTESLNQRLTARNLELVLENQRLLDQLREAEQLHQTRILGLETALNIANGRFAESEAEVRELQVRCNELSDQLAQSKAGTLTAVDTAKGLETQLKVAEKELKQLKASSPEKQAKLIKRLQKEKKELRESNELLKASRNKAADQNLQRVQQQHQRLVNSAKLIQGLYNLLRERSVSTIAQDGNYYAELIPYKISADGYTQCAVRIHHNDGGASRVVSIAQDNELGTAKAPKGGFQPPKSLQQTVQDFLQAMKRNNWQLSEQQVSQHTSFNQSLEEILSDYGLTLMLEQLNQ